MDDDRAGRVASAVAVLRELRAEDIAGDPALRELFDAGKALFKRPILQEEFGRQEVVEYLKEVQEQRALLRKLQHLQAQIAEQHAERCDEVRACQINRVRHQRLEAIEAGTPLAAPSLEDGSSAPPALPAPRDDGAPEISSGAPMADVAPGEHGRGRRRRVPRQHQLVYGVRHTGVKGGGATDTSNGDAHVDNADGQAVDDGSAEDPSADGDDGGCDAPAADVPRGEAPEAPNGHVAAEEATPEAIRGAATIPPGSFRRFCNTCKQRYDTLHHFYHQLCPECAEFNMAKRKQTADMRGMVCLVTGGRVRIGYHIVLKLLRAGARVLATTRFPADAALRYASERDFDEWSDRLEVVGPIELSDVGLVEELCDAIAARFGRLHVLINNAAQTLTREAGWFIRASELEREAASRLPAQARAMLVDTSREGGRLTLTHRPEAEAERIDADITAAPAASEPASAPAPAAAPAAAVAAPACDEVGTALEPSRAKLLATFPAGRLDESLQPLDLSPANSWSRRLGEVGTSELLHTMAANAIAPFVLCTRLSPLLAPKPAEVVWGQIVNVTALEGKFHVRKKQSCHPHTNMAKAALNMLSLTSAIGLGQDRIMINAVDTGWVTDMAPGGVGVLAATHETQVAPPLDEVDGAARVLDPVFRHVADPSWTERGCLWKDYKKSAW